VPRDTGVALGLLVLAGLYWLGADQIRVSTLEGIVGAQAVPKALAVGLAILSLLLIAQDLWRPRRPAVAAGGAEGEASGWPAHLRALGMLLIGVGYLVVVNTIGYVLAIVILVLFAGPLLVFVPQLRAAARRGMLQYGALAGSVGQAFEQKWLDRAGTPDPKALEVGDFSATTDLFDVVATVYEMKPVPLRVIDLASLVAAALVPLLPIWLLVMPAQDIVAGLAKFLF